jgi:hypothetical protein
MRAPRERYGLSLPSWFLAATLHAELPRFRAQGLLSANGFGVDSV